MANKKKEKTKKRVVAIDESGFAKIQATFNNIIISMTNRKGQVVSWSSAGKMGFKGAKKNTPYAAQVAAEDCTKKALDLGMKEANVYVKGTGAGRESAIRTINDTGIIVNEIRDVTPVAHGGCRPPKRRRP